MRIAKISILFVLMCFCTLHANAKSRVVYSPCGPDGCRNSLFGGNLALQYKLEYLQGRLWRHSQAIRGLDGDYTRGAEFAVEFPQLDGTGWVFYWNFPTVGLAAQYLNLGNKDYLGDAYTFYPYINLPIAKTKTSRIFSLNAKLGAGVSFLTKKYDKSLDPQLWEPAQPRDYSANNYAIGSVANVYLTAGLNFDLRFSKKNQGFWSRWGVLGEFAWSHYANGSVRKSDEGLDVLNVGVGLRYIPYMSPCPMRAGLDRLPRRWYFEPELTIGANRKHETDEKLYPTFTLRVGAYRPLANIYRMGLSVDAFYNMAFTKDRTLPEYYSGKNSPAGENASPFRLGVSWANELLFGKFTGGLQVGLYLMNKQTAHDGHCYLRLSGKYDVWNNIYVTAAVKAHKTEMESLEVGVGYSLYKKEKAPYSWLPEKKKKTPRSKVERAEQKTSKKDEVPMGKKAKKLSK